MSYTNAKRQLIATAMEVAPTEKEQEAFSKIVRNMSVAGEYDKDICIELLACMLNGLRSGNWPDPEKIV